MNICILFGKIVSKIEFDFIYNSKVHISLATFKLCLNNKIGSNYNKQIVIVKAYDEQADKVYRKLKNGDCIILNGHLYENGVNIEEFSKVF